MTQATRPLPDPSPAQLGEAPHDVSVIIISYNTREILRECLQRLGPALQGIDSEVIVVDNDSKDGSGAMVADKFSWVRLIRNPDNVGFAAANNLAIKLAQARFLILLNSDSFVDRDTIQRALTAMQADPTLGVGGARLIGQDGSWRPSARMFPSVLNDFIRLTGLADKFAKSRFLGRADRTWADPMLPTDVDWVPGCFMIIPKAVVDKTGAFDESFFFYYEEVDLCRRIKRAGYRVRYFPDVVVIHLEGASSRKPESSVSDARKRRMRWTFYSQFLYYRKHHGAVARWAMWTERTWYWFRSAVNLLRGASGRERLNESRAVIAMMEQAWRDTRGGRLAPPRPW